MREQIRNKERLEHILDAIDIILNNKSRFAFEQIENDPIIFYGFVKQIEIIGEAVYMLTKDFRSSHSELDWDTIEGMRHVLVHGYYKIKPDRVWATIQTDIPALRPHIVKYLQETNDLF